MKIAGFVAAFLAAAVSLWSNVTSDTALSLPQIVTINIDAFYTCQYKNIFDGGLADVSIDIHSIISKAQKILEKFTSSFGTTLKLKVLRKTEFGSCSSTVGEPNWNDMRRNSAKNGNGKADLFLYFTNTTSANMFPSLFHGKMCLKKRKHRTMRLNRGFTAILGTLKRVYRSARSLCYFIGRLLGIRADDDGRTAKDGLTPCPKGPMNFQRVPKREQESWNQCNAEDLSDFYASFQSCFVRPLPGVMIIDVHAFYDEAFKFKITLDTSTVETRINQVVEKAKEILNKDDYYLGTKFKLNVLQFNQDNGLKTYKEMISISKSQGSDQADLFAFFTYKADYLPESHIHYKPSICSSDRAYRTLSLTQYGLTTFGIARHLVYYIGLSLGIRRDEVNELHCPALGYMSNVDMDRGKPTWQQVDDFWNADRYWTQCNIKDMRAAYAKVTSSRVDGPVGRTTIRHCLDSQNRKGKQNNVSPQQQSDTSRKEDYEMEKELYLKLNFNRGSTDP